MITCAPYGEAHRLVRQRLSAVRGAAGLWHWTDGAVRTVGDADPASYYAAECALRGGTVRRGWRWGSAGGTAETQRRNQAVRGRLHAGDAADPHRHRPALERVYERR